MNYPLCLTFKLLAVTSQIYIRDAQGQLLGCAKQKAFKLKEDVRIYADEHQTQEIFQIRAERVIDWLACYHFIDTRTGQSLGMIKRSGMRSLWRVHYEIYDGDQVVMEIREENGWIKVLDGIVSGIPIIGLFAGYVFNPAYLVKQTNGTVVARLQKQPAFFEGKFQLTQIGQMTAAEETRVLLGVLIMTFLERVRG